MKPGINRRHLLRGLLGGSAVSLALPWLEAMTVGTRAARAGDSGFPVRFVLYFWGNGNLPDTWAPEDTGDSFTLTPQLAGLEALQHKICLVSGLSVPVDNVAPHSSGYAGLLSGHALEVDGENHTFAAPS
ncbi:MAG: DUF1552 domain-containing protein, partial [Myxococcota bacterium]|nr:DUF1552 domain-containing protein [Myxococcota bacterium]